MPTILGALQFHNHKIGGFVDAEQVNSALAIDPVAKLLSYEHQAVVQDANVFAEKSLQVATLEHTLSAEGGFGYGRQGVVENFKDRHG